MGKYAETEKDLLKAKPQSRHEFFTEQLRRKFIALPKRHKDLIRSAIEDGIEWHGEDTYHKLPQLDNLTHFEHVIREFMRMREVGIEQYKRQALDKVDSYEKRSLGKANPDRT